MMPSMRMMTTAMTAMMMMMMMMMMMLIRVWMEDKQSGAESPGIINGITALPTFDHTTMMTMMIIMTL